MNSSSGNSSVLAYKNESRAAEADVDTDQLDAFQLWTRFFLCPVVLPCLCCIIFCMQKDEQVAPTDIPGDNNEPQSQFERCCRTYCSCLVEADDPQLDSAEDNQRKQRIHILNNNRNRTPPSKKVVYYKLGTLVARTDKFQDPPNGHWEGNLYIENSESSTIISETESLLPKDPISQLDSKIKSISRAWKLSDSSLKSENSIKCDKLMSPRTGSGLLPSQIVNSVSSVNPDAKASIQNAASVDSNEDIKDEPSLLDTKIVNNHLRDSNEDNLFSSVDNEEKHGQDDGDNGAIATAASFSLFVQSCHKPTTSIAEANDAETNPFNQQQPPIMQRNSSRSISPILTPRLLFVASDKDPQIGTPDTVMDAGELPTLTTTERFYLERTIPYEATSLIPTEECKGADDTVCAFIGNKLLTNIMGVQNVVDSNAFESTKNSNCFPELDAFESTRGERETQVHNFQENPATIEVISRYSDNRTTVNLASPWMNPRKLSADQSLPGPHVAILSTPVDEIKSLFQKCPFATMDSDPFPLQNDCYSSASFSFVQDFDGNNCVGEDYNAETIFIPSNADVKTVARSITTPVVEGPRLTAIVHLHADIYSYDSDESLDDASHCSLQSEMSILSGKGIISAKRKHRRRRLAPRII